MVQYCCIVDCVNRSNRDRKHFFRLPKVPKKCSSKLKVDLIVRRRKQWLKNINRLDLNDGDCTYSPGYIRVCSDHFTTGLPSDLTDVDHPDWAPTLNMGLGSVRVKGSKEKKMIYRKLTPKCEPRNTVDPKEIARRRKLALSVETLLKKTQAHYKHPSRRSKMTKSEELSESNPHKTRAKKSFMNRKTPMVVKKSMPKIRFRSTLQKRKKSLPSSKSADTDVSDSPRTDLTTSAIIHKITGLGRDTKIGERVNDSCEINGSNVTNDSDHPENVETECSHVRVTDLELLLIDQLMNEHLSPSETEQMKHESHAETECGLKS